MSNTSYLIGLVLFVLSLLCSCETAEVPNSGKETQYGLSIHLTGFDVKYSDIETRGLVNSSRRISFAAFNEAHEKVDSLEQVEGYVSAFGELSCKLKTGKYTLIAVVHSSSEPADISDERVCFVNDSITDTFLATQEIVISDDTPIAEINMKANRTVSLFRLTCKDQLPENIKSFRVKVSCGDTRLNPHNGFSINDRAHLYYNMVSPADRGKKDYSFDIYTFLPSETKTSDIIVTATSLDGDEIKTVSFNNIKLGINKKTEAQGAFFIQKQSIGIGYDDAWGAEEIIEY